MVFEFDELFFDDFVGVFGFFVVVCLVFFVCFVFFVYVGLVFLWCVFEDEYCVVVGGVVDCCVWNYYYVFGLWQLNVDVSEYIGVQFVVFVFKVCLYGYVMGCFVDVGFDGGNFFFELLVGVGVQCYVYFQVFFDMVQFLFGQSKIDKDWL